MIKKLFAALLSLLAAAAFAAVDVNKATQADLESIKGIGPVISAKIVDERKKAPFKDWNDMVTRVKGVGEGNAAKFSADGLTVNGAAFAGAPAVSAKPEGKKTTKSDAKAPTAAADTGKATKTAAKPAEPTAVAPAPDKKGTSTAAATDETRAKRAEERKAEAAVKAKEKAAKRAAEASAPAAAASGVSKKK